MMWLVASIQDLISNIKAEQIMCKDCCEYILTFVACFRHQSCLRWRRVAGRHWLPFITQLPVCTCHLECVYVWVYIIVIQYQLHHSNVIMSKKRNLSHVGTQRCLDKRSGISQLVPCPVGRTHRSIDQRLANVNVQIRTVAPPSDHGKSYNFP